MLACMRVKKMLQATGQEHARDHVQSEEHGLQVASKTDLSLSKKLRAA